MNKIPSNFFTNNINISDPMEIANQFCNYFSNIGLNLAKNIPVSQYTHHSYLNANFINSIFLQPVSELELNVIIKSCRPKTAAGWDKIPMWALKVSFEYICKPLTHIVKLSIESGIVPNQMKIGRVVPIYKSGPNNLFSNY